MKITTLVPVFALATLAAACGEGSPAGSDADAISRTEAVELAAEYEGLSAVMFEGFGAPSFSVSAAEGEAALAVTTTTQFTRTRTCPEGGSVTVTGTNVNTRDAQTRTGSHELTATRTENDCVLRRRGGATLTIDGNPSTQITGKQTWTDGTPGVRTRTAKGGFTWSRSTGETGACTVDLTSTWDPATRTHTVKGTFCNQTIDVTRTHTES